MRKLVSMLTETRKIQQITPAVGIARDLDCVAQKAFRGKRVKAQIANGDVVWGTVDFVTDAGFRGIEVHVIVGGTRRIANIEKCRVWAER